jgi:hypothetical protein
MAALLGARPNLDIGRCISFRQHFLGFPVVTVVCFITRPSCLFLFRSCRMPFRESFRYLSHAHALLPTTAISIVHWRTSFSNAVKSEMEMSTGHGLSDHLIDPLAVYDGLSSYLGS